MLLKDDHTHYDTFCGNDDKCSRNDHNCSGNDDKTVFVGSLRIFYHTKLFHVL